MIDIQKESVTHYLELHSDRFGRTWECSCGLWTLRADYGWTHTPDGRHARPVPAVTPGDANHLHHHHAEQTLRNDRVLYPTSDRRHRTMLGL